jgi:hypothetical protein
LGAVLIIFISLGPFCPPGPLTQWSSFGLVDWMVLQHFVD